MTENGVKPNSAGGEVHNGEAAKACSGSDSTPALHAYYAIGRFFYYAFGIWLPLRVAGIGWGKVPARGGVILASNHSSFLDPIITSVAIHRPLRFFARSTLFKNRFFGKFIKMFGTIPAKRGGADYKALRRVMEMLKGGEMVVIYPEGTRTFDGNLQELKPGFAFLAESTGAPVFPVYVHGSFESFGRGRPLRLFLRHWVLIGDPLHLNDVPAGLSGKSRREWLVEETAARLKALENEARERWPLRDYSSADNTGSEKSG